MAIRFERPVSRAAFAARRVGFLAFLLCLAAFAAFRFGPLTAPDFAALELAAAALALVAALLAAVGLAQLWQVGALGGLAAFRALLYASLPLGLVGVAALAYATAPALYDLSTDPADPPPFLKPGEVNQQWLPRGQGEPGQEGAYADLVGQRFDGAPDRVAAAVRKAARSARIRIIETQGEETVADAPPMDRPVLPPGEVRGPIPVPLPRPEPLLSPPPPPFAGKPGDVLIQGETRTLVFGLPFDVMIRLREEEEGTVVDMRVVARYGDSDFGLGARIARAFLEALESEVLGLG